MGTTLSIFGNSRRGLSIVSGRTLSKDKFGVGRTVAKLFILYLSVIIDLICSIFVGVADRSFGNEVLGDEENEVEELVKNFTRSSFCCVCQ
jgi:hypothetical protein